MIEIIQELADRLTDLEEAFDRSVRWAKVASVDEGASTVTVEYPDGLVSAPMACALMGARLHLPPSVGEPAVVLCPGGHADAAFAVCGTGVLDSGLGEVDEIAGVLSHDRSSGEVGLGASPSDYVALAQKVDDMGAALADAIENHIHTTTAVIATGGAVGVISPTSTTVALSSTAASKVKAE